MVTILVVTIYVWNLLSMKYYFVQFSAKCHTSSQILMSCGILQTFGQSRNENNLDEIQIAHVDLVTMIISYCNVSFRIYFAIPYRCTWHRFDREPPHTYEKRCHVLLSYGSKQSRRQWFGAHCDVAVMLVVWIKVNYTTWWRHQMETFSA